jgi:DNA polymerase III subunit gamma/tau
MKADNRYEDFHLKYRPNKFKDVVGHKRVVDSLKSLMKEDKLPHSFIFAGPSGTGKTTLARILARKLQPNSAIEPYIEIDAANNTGVDAMRELLESINYAGLGSSGIKFIILDEAHELSKNAFDALLKPLEDTPEHVYFALCTTELQKIPKTIVTRCHTFNLQELRTDDVCDMLEYIHKKEGLSIPKEALVIIARESFGSMRQALVFLSQCRNCKDVDEVAELLASPENSTEVIELCRFILDGRGGWTRALELLRSMRKMNPESIRIVVANYLTACVLNAKSEKDSLRFLDKLQCFSKPIYSKQAFHDIVLNVADCVFQK